MVRIVFGDVVIFLILRRYLSFSCIMGEKVRLLLLISDLVREENFFVKL